MEFDAKETRMVILSLKLMLKQTFEQLNTVDEESDEAVFLANDAAMLESIIGDYEANYRDRFGPKAV